MTTAIRKPRIWQERFVTVEALTVGREKGNVEDWMMRALAARIPFRVVWLGESIARFDVPQSRADHAARLWREVRNS